MRILFAAILVAAGGIGCSDDFNPSITGPRPYVVFAILNPAIDTQIVRVHATSEPADPHPPLLGVPGATVTITGSSGMISYQPVDLHGTPGTVDSVIPAFQAPSFHPLRGGTYTLVVTAPSGTATATIEVPSYTPGSMSIQDFLLIQNPHSYPLESPIILTSILARQTLGFTVRFQIEYEVLRNAVWVVEQWEVPTVYLSNNGPSDFVAQYPTLRRRNGTAAVGSGPQTAETTFYLNSTYEATISLIHATYGTPNIRMKRAVFLLQQADRHFFTYYSYANSFQDRLTIRVDQPDYTNMDGALGFFGSMTIDTLAFPLSSVLRPR